MILRDMGRVGGGERRGVGGGGEGVLLCRVVFPVNGGSAATTREVSGKSTSISEPTNRDMILEISNHLQINAEISQHLIS